MTTDQLEQERETSAARGCDCADHDEDCPDLEDKVGCWLYAPERGMCPYLRATPPKGAEP
jgi:hypothetical protein